MLRFPFKESLKRQAIQGPGRAQVGLRLEILSTGETGKVDGKRPMQEAASDVTEATSSPKSDHRRGQRRSGADSAAYTWTCHIHSNMSGAHSNSGIIDAIACALTAGSCKTAL